MRLTLRTLLAYIDDTLDPDDAKLIGQKVAESEVARELIDRIKKVTRRRGLANPPTDANGAAVNPNLIADYLDNELPNDQLEAVEGVALKSDAHLAEIAACHQILTLVLGEPMLVPPTARTRMVGLVKGREAIPYRKPAPQPMPAAPGDLAVPDRDEVDDTLLLGLPAVSRDDPLSKRLAPLAGALVLTAGLAAALYMAMPPLGPPEPNEQQVAVVTPKAEPKVEPKVEPKPEPKAEPKVEPKVEPKPEPKAEPKVEPKVEPKPEPKAEPKVEPKEPAVPKQPIDQPPAGKPLEGRREVGVFVSPNKVLLRPAGDQPGAGWKRILPETRVSTGETLLSLPGYRNEIKLDSGVVLTLWGNVPEFLNAPLLEAEATLHPPPAGLDADLTLAAGRIALLNRKSESARVRVRFLNEVWDLTLVDADGEVILDLFGRGTAPSRDAGREAPHLIAFLGVVKGRVGMKTGYRTLPQMTAPAEVIWDNKGPGLEGPTAMQAPSPFWSKSLPTQSPMKEYAQKMLESLGQLSQALTGNKDVVLALNETRTSQDGGPTSRVLGVFGLQAVGALKPLLDSLDDANYPEVRGSAIEALQHWVGRAEGNDLALRKVLIQDKGYNERTADIVISLLYRFPVAAQEDPLTYEALLAYMGHDKLAVRELAFWHLIRLDPDGARRIPYNPAADAEFRARGIAEWKKRIPDGKVPPPPMRQ